MNGGPDWRRLLPPPRRRAGLGAILVRWRVEVLLALGAGALGLYGDLRVVALLAGATALVSATTATGRAAAVRLWQLLAVPHRVRSAFAEAGVTSRQGRLPWIFYARPAPSATQWSSRSASGLVPRCATCATASR